MTEANAAEYLERISSWQAQHGPGVPPVRFDKKLSNWIQYCRSAARRGALSGTTAEALRARGIRLDPGPTNDSCDPEKVLRLSGPRGMRPVLAAVLKRIQSQRRAPTLLSDHVGERHQASWLIRLQAGILPGNAFGPTSPAHEMQLLLEVLETVSSCQSERDMLAEWVLWCARAEHATCDRSAPGNRWHERLYLASEQLMCHRYPAPMRDAATVRAGASRADRRIPWPSEVVKMLNDRLFTKDPALRVRFEKESPFGAPMQDLIFSLTMRSRRTGRRAPRSQAQ